LFVCVCEEGFSRRKWNGHIQATLVEVLEL
jgi:hypothetical protein